MTKEEKKMFAMFRAKKNREDKAAKVQRRADIYAYEAAFKVALRENQKAHSSAGEILAPIITKLLDFLKADGTCNGDVLKQGMDYLYLYRYDINETRWGVGRAMFESDTTNWVIRDHSHFHYPEDLLQIHEIELSPEDLLRLHKIELQAVKFALVDFPVKHSDMTTSAE